MMAIFFLVALCLILIGGMCSSVFRTVSTKIEPVIVGAICTGCLIGLIPAVFVVITGQMVTIAGGMGFPVGELALQIDSLSAFFLIPIFILAGLSSVYGMGYLQGHKRTGSIRIHWLLYSVFVVAMVGVVVAHDAIAFLVFWEIMTVVSFFLVTFDSEKTEVQEAGRIYIVVSHVGVACLLAMFILLGGSTATTGFGTFGFQGNSMLGTGIFLLALVGFGIKAGFIPLHVWLPEAHPAAPSHISALMSGVMIKLGIYGLMRLLSFVPEPPLWWGAALIAIGIVSGVLGILWGILQDDLKKVLAYSSIENMGIICIGLGVGVVGIASNSAVVSALGFAGALLHSLNHALFKGLLFFGAGAIQHATGTRNMERLGGLLKKMKVSGVAFFIGAAAICGLPPLNGFVSEFLIYMASFYGGIHLTSGWSGALVFSAIVALALIGALAMVCFTRIFGIVFLGEPRSEVAAKGQEVNRRMRYPMVALGALCIVIGLVGIFAIDFLANPVGQISVGLQGETAASLSSYSLLWRKMSYLVGALIAIVIVLGALRYWLMRKRSIKSTCTWDCGYAAPTSRMQYTGSSFVQPVMDLFSLFYSPEKTLRKPEGYFPQDGSLQMVYKDFFMSKIYLPVFGFFQTFADRLKIFQNGSTHLYVLYILVVLVVFSVWKLV